MTRIILDTDIDTDCDDAGALAVLHTLATRGDADILGVVCSMPVRSCVACVKKINEWYGRVSIPVGAVDPAAWQGVPSLENYMAHRRALGEKGMLYNEVLGGRWLEGNELPDVPESTRLYRRLLAAQPDQSVTICAIGTLTAVAGLLRSGPDDICRLPGRELVARKVQSLVTMAIASYPSGRDSFNWRMDMPSASMVVREWPVRLTAQPVGKKVLTGARFMASVAGDHPVRTAYRTWLRSETANRPSWDQLTVIYAVCGRAGMFRERDGLSLSLDGDSGCHEWTAAAGAAPARAVIEAAVSDDRLAELVENLMIGIP